MKHTNAITWLLILMPQLLNVSYFPGLSSDFSNLGAYVRLENETLPINHSICLYEPGNWSLVNVSGAYENRTIEFRAFLSSYGTSQFLNISFLPPLDENFSNLLLESECPDGTRAGLNYEISSFEPGSWAYLLVNEPIPEPCFIRISAPLGSSVQAPAPPPGNESNWLAGPPGNTSSAPGGNQNFSLLCYIYCEGRDLYEPQTLSDGNCTYQITPNSSLSSDFGSDPNATGETGYSAVSLFAEDSKGTVFPAKKAFFRQGAGEKALETGFDGPQTAYSLLQNGQYRVALVFNELSPVNSMEIVGAEISGNPVLKVKIDNVGTAKFPKYAKVYAIDLSGINFTSATANVTAEGTELYKCKDWDFYSQSCLGDWVKMRDITSGEQYSLNLAPEDPGYAEKLAITGCNREYAASSSGTWNANCQNSYPGPALFALDSLREVTSTQRQAANVYWGGLRINSSNTSVTDCYSIESVSICYNWWSATSNIGTCSIAVDANNGASYSTASSTCPGTSQPASITCTDATSLESWSCSNFFGSSYAIAKAEAVHSGSGVADYYNLTWDAFYFNVSYGSFGCGATTVGDVNLTRNYDCNGTAFSIGAASSTFDCKGYNITGNTTGIGISAVSRTNITIKNCVISNFSDGVYFNNTNLSFIQNTTVKNSAAYGLRIQNSSNNNLTSNNVTTSTTAGLLFATGSASNNLSATWICSNGLDIQSQGTGNIGSADYCDTFLIWNESNHWGCGRSCTSIWQKIFGNVTGSIDLRDAAAKSVYTWTANGLNVYFVDRDSTVNWATLYAIGRTTSGGASTNDFIELDNNFSTSPYSDNITTTYSTGGSTPKSTQSFTVYGGVISNVPVANSSLASTNFKTGILWDSTKGGTEYSNAYNQTAVWVVKVNASASDAYGVYDFLGQIPTTLGNYEGANNIVDIYVDFN